MCLVCVGWLFISVVRRWIKLDVGYLLEIKSGVLVSYKIKPQCEWTNEWRSEEHYQNHPPSHRIGSGTGRESADYSDSTPARVLYWIGCCIQRNIVEERLEHQVSLATTTVCGDIEPRKGSRISCRLLLILCCVLYGSSKKKTTLMTKEKEDIRNKNWPFLLLLSVPIILGLWSGQAKPAALSWSGRE